jgi:hypothetical protein
MLPLSFATYIQMSSRSASGRGEFREKAGASALLHFLRKLLHGLLRDHAALALGKRSPSVIKREKKFRPLPLALSHKASASCTHLLRSAAVRFQSRAGRRPFDLA